MTLSVVIPVYNSEAILPELAKRLAAALPSLAPAYEVVLVNDGSRDGSWAAIERLSAEHAWIRGINLMRNYGQHNALLCGIRAARHEVVVTMDDDLQHPPEEVGKLLAKLGEGHDVVYGTPEREEHAPWRVLASRMTKSAMKSALGAATAPQVSAFRAFRTLLREAFREYRSPFLSIDVLLAWSTTRFASVAVRHDPRHSGASNYTLGKLITHAMNMVTGFSTWPLRLASFIGFFFTLFGLGVLVYVVSRYLILGYSVPGFPFLASIIAIFAGAQLFALGIIGEYLARVHFRMMDRPMYAVRSTTFKP